MRIVIRYKNGDIQGPTGYYTPSVELGPEQLEWFGAYVAEIEIGEPKEREA